MKRTLLKRITAIFTAFMVSASAALMTVNAEDNESGWRKYSKFSYSSGVELKLDDLMPPSKPDDYLKESLQTIQQIANSEISGAYQDLAQNGLEKTINWFTKSGEIKNIQKSIDLIAREKDAMKIRKGLGMFAMSNQFDKEKYTYLEKLHNKNLDKKLGVLTDQKNALANGSAKTGMAQKAGKALGVIFTIKSCVDYYDNPNIGFKSPTLELLGSSIKAGSAASGFFSDVPVVGKIASTLYGVADLAVNNPMVVEYCNRNNISFGYIDETVSKTNDNIQYLFEWLFFSDVDEQIRKNEEEMRQRREKLGLQTPQGNGVGVYKPNIYLYPTENTEVSVSFALPDLLTKTIPDYNSGWTAEVSPDGILTVDGQDYGYLFYESETYPHYWQTEEGFVIPAENREETFRSILTGYGLNETEINDFCEFWCDKLESDTAYAMYPQLTEAVDAAMPADITPAPDTIVRLWFAFSPDTIPEKAASAEAVQREGFTVIEWGGLFL